MENKIISFKCQKKFYYFFIFWILELVLIICDNYIPYKYLIINMSFNDLKPNKVELENKKVEQLTTVICRILSKLLAGIGILCNYEIMIDNTNINKKKIYLLILASLLLFLLKLINFFYYLFTKCVDKLKDYVMDWGVGIYIISTIIFCKYINKEINFYKHHKVSIVITLISIFFMTFVNIYSIIKEDKNIEYINKLVYIILNVFNSICFPFINSISKILMDKYLTPIKLIFWEGIFESILLIIYLSILYFAQVIKLGNFNFDNETLIIWIIVKIGYIIICYVRNLMILKIINYFNPTYLFFMISINSFISFVARFFMKKKDSVYNESVWFIILDCISLAILSFGTLLYNEILTIHKFGLDEKIRLKLEDNALNDEKISSVYNEDIDESFEL